MNTKIFTLIASLFLAQQLVCQSVELNVLGAQPDFNYGVQWGVPFARGEVKSAQQFELQNNRNENIPLQTFILARWDDGSVKWLGCAAAVAPAEKFFLKKTDKKTQNQGITVKNSADFIEINNGKFVCTIGKQGLELIRSIAFGDKSVSENGRLLCSLEHKSGDNTNIESFTGEIKTVSLEDSGAVRTVVKIEGKYRSQTNGREFLPFTVRLYFYNGIENIRAIHSFIYDGDQFKDFIKSLGIAFDVPMREALHNRHIRFSGENGGLWSEPVKVLVGRAPFVYKGDRTFTEKQMKSEFVPNILPDDSLAYTFYNHFANWNDFRLTQLNSNGFSISKRTNDESSWLHSNSGSRSSGLVLAGDVNGGLAISLKDFWQSYPASLEVKNAATDKAQIAVWFWSPNADAMDLRHYDTIPHDLDATYEDVNIETSTPYGIARTSEITLFPFDKLPSKNETVAMADFGSQTHLLIAAPQYLYDKKAFGTWSLPNKINNPTAKYIENQLDSAFIFYKKAIDERDWYGFWNYGDIMHTYDGYRHVWRYDIGGFAWDNTELAPNDWLWYSFLRSGREDIFRVAEAMTRHTAEVDMYHIGEMKGLGSRHNVSHWGCGAKEARIGQAAWKRFYYYLAADERSGDVMRESLDAEKALIKYEPLRTAQPRDKFPYNSPTRLRWGPDWLALVGNWFAEWERTGNIIYKNKILAGMKSLTKLPNNLFTGPNGLGYDPQTSTFSYDGDSQTVNNNHLATIMGGYEILTEVFQNIDYKPFKDEFTQYAKFYGMPKNDPQRTEQTKKWGNIAFRNPRLTAFAAKELNDNDLAKRAWNEFLNVSPRQRESNRNIYGAKIVLPPETLNPVHENPFVSTNSTAQWGLNAIIMLELIGDKLPDSIRNNFEKAQNLQWKQVFADDMRKQWQTNWFLDGEKAKLTNTARGLTFAAGSTPASDADHAVLWSKRTFSGDLRIEFDFTKIDDASKFVNILYTYAEGSGAAPYSTDISAWNDLRKIPAMKTYYEHMNALHISFAAFENDNSNLAADYIRARQYRPESGNGLAGTALLPDYANTGLFRQSEKYHITFIRQGKDVYFNINNKDSNYLCHWTLRNADDLQSGRIGLRLMGGRVSQFSNVKILRVFN